jgi:chlorobactene lauroyltransferase
MIKAKKSGFFNIFFKFYINRILKKNFFRIHISGRENLNLLDKNLPTIYYANHTNWWDGFTAYFLTNMTLKLDDYLMMDIEQMKKYRMFKYVGVFSVDRNNPREAVSSVDYAALLLKGTKRCMWIFPEGEMHVQDHYPITFYSGITKISEKIGNVNLQPAAFRYEFIGEQRPEIFISIGKGDIFKSKEKPDKNYTIYLQDKLTAEVKLLKEKVINSQFESFQIVFKGKESRNKTVDRITR